MKIFIKDIYYFSGVETYHVSNYTKSQTATTPYSHGNKNENSFGMTGWSQVICSSGTIRNGYSLG